MADDFMALGIKLEQDVAVTIINLKKSDLPSQVRLKSAKTERLL